MAIDRQQKLIQIVNQELILFRASDVAGFIMILGTISTKPKYIQYNMSLIYLQVDRDLHVHDVHVGDMNGGSLMHSTRKLHNTF